MTSLSKAVQCSIFDYVSKPTPVEGYEIGSHDTIFRSNAEALVHDIGKMPSGMGNYLRCMPIDHKASYNQKLAEWDAEFWFQASAGSYRKLMSASGRVRDIIRPYSIGRIYKNGQNTEDNPKMEIVAATIDGDLLIMTDTDGKEWSMDIVSDDNIARYDRHPFSPEHVLEHLAIECYKHSLPLDVIMPVHHGPCDVDCLRPFSDTRESRDGIRIYEKNEDFIKICHAAELCSIKLRLKYDVSPLEPDIYPIQQKCQNCTKNPKTGGGCRNTDHGTGFCLDGWVWDRRPIKKKTASKIMKEEEMEASA